MLDLTPPNYKMRYLIFLLVSSLICTLNLTAQSYEVSGTVKDGNNEVVAYANVYLLRISDSTIVKGASSSEEGKFVITNIAPEIYFITASYIGQKSKLTPIDIRQDISVGSLVIENTFESLDEVVVVAQKPTIQRKVDRVVFNVENTILSENSSWDIIRRTPGVIMAQDQIKVKGLTPTIYLNDRKMQLTQAEIQDLLEGLSGSNVKSIEVIPNPPAKYDAEGGPILNIITLKGINPGYKGKVNGSLTQAIYSKYNLGTSHYFKNEKINVFANYSISPKKVNKQTIQNIYFLNSSNAVYSSWTTDYNRIERSLGHAASVIIDYSLDDRNTISLTTNGTYSPNRTYNNLLFGSIKNGLEQLDSTITNTSNLNIDNHNVGVDLTYKHLLKKNDGALTINGHYTNYGERKMQYASSDYHDSNASFLRNYSFNTNANQDINIFTGQIDYSSLFGKMFFETGAKVSNIESTSGIDYFNTIGANDTFNPSLSDDFEYHETVSAGYVSLRQNWEKWTLKAGLRGEQTDVKGVSITLNSVNIQKYFKLFPTAYFLYTPSDNHSFSLNYSKKLDRPRYDDLNPFRYFLNENDYYIGNPNLKAYYTNEVKLNYTLNGDYFFDFYYRDNGHYISDLALQNNESQTLRSFQQNDISAISYAFEVTVSKAILNNWSIYAYSSAFHEDETFLALESNNQKFKNSLNAFYLYLGNYVTLNKEGTLTGEIGLSHWSNYMGGSYIIGKSTDLSLGLRKTLWKNRASLSLQFQDILNTQNTLHTSKYLNQNNSYTPISETQYVRFGFNYNFGNFKLQDNEKSISKKERDRI